MVSNNEKIPEEKATIQEIDKAKVITQNIDMKEDNTVWLECMIKPTPRGYTIWVPKGAFK